MKKRKNRVGFLEKVIVYGPKGQKTVIARVDTGAARNSIDDKLAKKLGIKKVIKHKVVKSAHGVKKRPIVKAKLKIAGKTLDNMTFTLADRKHMKYDVLVGRNTLKEGFVVDPDK
ncbi:RimK/LysX family protein [Candidatus Woesearchaeota archaeon]|nr:RimK/LysX family protein [Candidatus Woesearchaeota archaeon]MBW3006460.1 RimK/LysX family protein [Candidatus Woesearchaeota archaeon]